jgi:hypothetical protein
MSQLVYTLTLVASSLGYDHVPTSFFNAVEQACGRDESCAIDATVYAAHESGFEARPTPRSWDARRQVSCGLWQTPCITLPSTALGQARAWVALRAESLARFGSLVGLAGDTPAGRVVTKAREAEIQDCRFAARWASH